MRRTADRVVEVSASDDIDSARLAVLYRRLYLEKHCRLNAAFNAHFFALLLRTPFFRTHIFVHGERIDSFSVMYSNDGYLTSALVGYDTALPPSLGLYRLTMMHTLQLAESHGTLLNISGGAGRFKTLRGAFPVREFDAVFDAHLPRWRRLPWHLAELEGRLWHMPRRQDGLAAG